MDSTLFDDIEEFFLLGPSNPRGEEVTVQDISSCSNNLLDRLKKKTDAEKEFHENLIRTTTKVEDLHSRLDSSELFQKQQVYVKTNYKLQLTVLAKTLCLLEKCENVNEIPNIIISIKNKIPDVLLERSNMKKMVNSVVQKKKSFLLDHFQAAFDKQLSQESETTNLHPQNQHGSLIWESFLEKSRDWLLAYSLVCVLPATLVNASDSFVLGVYQESVDTALTPIWGRLYFHLLIARESKSLDQLLWSFHYAKSFITMLLQLGNAMTSSDTPLHTLSAVNYHIAFQQLILEKSMKFMKAHVAMVLEEVDLWSGEGVGLQVVEELLDFDDWWTGCGGGGETAAVDGEGSGSVSGCGLCGVLYEAKEHFHAWLLLEQSLLHQRLRTTCAQDPDTAFQVLFQPSLAPSGSSSSSSPTTEVENTPSTSTSTAAGTGGSGTGTSTVCCYASLYSCLSVFVLARDRYRAFPRAAQYLLSDLVLEPLLCLALGLLLYRIRSDPLLYALSVHTPSTSSSSNTSSSTSSSLSLALTTFHHAVHYFQSALGKPSIPSSSSSSSTFCANAKRCKHRWTIVQNWMPKIFIGPEQAQAGFSLADLFKTAMKTSEKYRQSYPHQYAYRQEISLELQQGKESVSDLEECVVMTRGLAITLVNVLENQFRQKE